MIWNFFNMNTTGLKSLLEKYFSRRLAILNTGGQDFGLPAQLATKPSVIARLCEPIYIGGP